MFAFTVTYDCSSGGGDFLTGFLPLLYSNLSLFLRMVASSNICALVGGVIGLLPLVLAAGLTLGDASASLETTGAATNNISTFNDDNDNEDTTADDDDNDDDDDDDDDDDNDEYVDDIKLCKFFLYIYW